MSRCNNCESVFFKTLEIRALTGRLQAPAILYKKRCRRCKFKYFFSKDAATGRSTLTTHAVWLRGDRIAGAYELGGGDKFHMIVSEYSRRAARSADVRLLAKEAREAAGGQP